MVIGEKRLVTVRAASQRLNRKLRRDDRWLAKSTRREMSSGMGPWQILNSNIVRDSGTLAELIDRHFEGEILASYERLEKE